MPSLREMFEQRVSDYRYDAIKLSEDLIVSVRTLSAKERQAYDTLLIKVNKKDPRKTEYLYSKQKNLLVQMTLCASNDRTPALMYNHFDELMDCVMDSSVIDKVYEVSAALNGLVDTGEADDDGGIGPTGKS